MWWSGGAASDADKIVIFFVVLWPLCIDAVV